MANLKTELVEALLASLDEKIKDNEIAIKNAVESLENETKSSVGDKYETGRTMVHAEIEKHQIQLGQNTKLKNDVLSINTNSNHKNVQFGSVVQTNKLNYFISIPYGKLTYRKKDYYCISLASPIGQLLLDQKVKAKISFQTQKFTITKVT